jgi:GNAT superfamily N-acetyltransferase
MLSLDLKINYRSARQADLPLLLELVQEFHEFEELPFDLSLDRTALDQIVMDPLLGRIWLIYESSNVIGYVIVTFGYSLEYRGREACVDELYLRPAYRRRGIGSQTLQFVESECRSLNVNFLSLEVYRDNNSAQIVYRKAGFKDDGYCLMTKSIA